MALGNEHRFMFGWPIFRHCGFFGLETIRANKNISLLPPGVYIYALWDTESLTPVYIGLTRKGTARAYEHLTRAMSYAHDILTHKSVNTNGWTFEFWEIMGRYPVSPRYIEHSLSCKLESCNLFKDSELNTSWGKEMQHWYKSQKEKYNRKLRRQKVKDRKLETAKQVAFILSRINPDTK